jgi:hypothetical protein
MNTDKKVLGPTAFGAGTEGNASLDLGIELPPSAICSQGKENEVVAA